MGLTQFRRRFQVLDPALMKELTSAPEGVDERKVCGPGGGGGGAPTLLFCRAWPGGSWGSWDLRVGSWGKDEGGVTFDSHPCSRLCSLQCHLQHCPSQNGPSETLHEEVQEKNQNHRKSRSEVGGLPAG